MGESSIRTDTYRDLEGRNTHPWHRGPYAAEHLGKYRSHPQRAAADLAVAKR